MPSGLLGLSLSGLNAAQMGIRTTQQNIANINTPSYRRQEVAYSAAQPQFSGVGFIGNGVMVDAIHHQYNQFLDNEVLLNQTMLSRYSAASNRASQLDKLLGDSDSGLSTPLSAFFGAIQEVANDPTSASTRQNLLSAGENLGSRFNSLADQLQKYRASTNNDMQAVIARINILSGQIAKANAAIAQNTSVNGQPSNDLVDNRDHLIAELNKLINVSTQDLGNGMVNVFVGNGQALVLGVGANTMGTTTGSPDASLRVPTISVNGSTLQLSSDMISGGELGGLLDFRANVLVPAIEDLNRIAMGVATAINNVQTAGLDYNLAAGLDFFTNPVVPQGATTGQLGMTLANDLDMDPLGYDLQLTAAGYVLTPASTGVSTTYASLAAMNTALSASDGFTLAAGVSAPAVGDHWIIGNYARQMRVELTSTDQIAAAAAGAGGPGDNANALAMAALQTAQRLNNGTTTFSGSYHQTVGRTAVETSQTDLNLKAYQNLTDVAVTAQASQVGVNLDEEAAKLIQFQQAYQASAKAMQVANSLFDSILGILG